MRDSRIRNAAESQRKRKATKCGANPAKIKNQFLFLAGGSEGVTVR
jgi:hypothetical protein